MLSHDHEDNSTKTDTSPKLPEPYIRFCRDRYCRGQVVDRGPGIMLGSVTDSLRDPSMPTLIFSSVKWERGRIDKITSKVHTNVNILGYWVKWSPLHP